MVEQLHGTDYLVQCAAPVVIRNLAIRSHLRLTQGGLMPAGVGAHGHYDVHVRGRRHAAVCVCQARRAGRHHPPGQLRQLRQHLPHPVPDHDQCAPLPSRIPPPCVCDCVSVALCSPCQLHFDSTRTVMARAQLRATPVLFKIVCATLCAFQLHTSFGCQWQCSSALLDRSISG